MWSLERCMTKSIAFWYEAGWWWQKLGQTLQYLQRETNIIIIIFTIIYWQTIREVIF